MALKSLRRRALRWWMRRRRGETCPYYWGTGHCIGGRSCYAVGEPTCVTSGEPPRFRWRYDR